MAPTNGYATQQQLKDMVRITSTDTTDDGTIDDFITDASRLIDELCGRYFYANSATRLIDSPKPDADQRVLRLPDDLLSVTSITNGDGTVLAVSDYVLLPDAWPSKYEVRLKGNSGLVWLPDTYGNREQAISVVGSWGFVNRSASDPVSARIISNTRRACLSIANNWYKKRFGEQVEGNAQVTGSGVVILPNGIPKEAWDLISAYKRR